MMRKTSYCSSAEKPTVASAAWRKGVRVLASNQLLDISILADLELPPFKRIVNPIDGRSAVFKILIVLRTVTQQKFV